MDDSSFWLPRTSPVNHKILIIISRIRTVNNSVVRITPKGFPRNSDELNRWFPLLGIRISDQKENWVKNS